jgi:hypothetical protein
MKKFMVADLVKDLKQDQINSLLRDYNITRSDAEYIVDNYRDTNIQDLIAKAMDEYGLNMRNAEEFVKNYPNESAWADVEEVAESLGVDITDVEDDDVENYMSMGGNKGELPSSVSKEPIRWIYDNILKAYIIYMVLETSKGPTDIMYKLSPEMMKDWKDSDSFGEYYNTFIKGNEDIEDQDYSCGCSPNPCEQGQIDQFNTKYESIS